MRHRAVVETGKMNVREQHLDRSAGPYQWVMAVRFPVLDAEGRVGAVGTFAVDITERKEAEAALLASEARLNAIIAANPVALNIARLSDRRLLFVNRPYVELFGLEGLDLDSFDRDTLYLDPSERDWIYQEIAAGREVTNFEVVLRRTDGVEVPTSLTSRRILFQGEPALVTSAVDLTALRAAQARGRAVARGAAPEREADGARGAARRRGARAQQSAVGGRRLFVDADGARSRTGDGRADRENPCRGGALRADRANLPRHGPGAAAEAGAGGARATW